jgi:hypothetical protein
VIVGFYQPLDGSGYVIALTTTNARTARGLKLLARSISPDGSD